jgi:hypothetical protein
MGVTLAALGSVLRSRFASSSAPAGRASRVVSAHPVLRLRLGWQPALAGLQSPLTQKSRKLEDSSCRRRR